ncbi:Hypothetical predicted protein [Olea europaea subsp. europaea]|uniref:Uncharacterized protein n=1 Tax=Olea europaea subsp. europaea TaxID=158383 RepID=A0A8S0UC43_OLEEU|nr:Hypothetical predicted protein [Olea europaea subsp. europaea]
MTRRLISYFGKGFSSSHSMHESSYENATVNLLGEEQKIDPPVLVELLSCQGCDTSPEAGLPIHGWKGVNLFWNRTSQVRALNKQHSKTVQKSLQVTFTGALRTKVDEEANVMVALYASRLVKTVPTEPTKIKSRPMIVFTRIEKLCSSKDISAKRPASRTVDFPLWEGFNSTKCGAAIPLETAAHQILSSQNFKLPDNP